jgi:hypothetical protein
MIKLLPNLVDISDINRDIQTTIFRTTTYRVNIVLGLFFIFLILTFIYFGINKKTNEIKENTDIDDNDYYINDDKDDDITSDYYDVDYITPIDYSSNAYELALTS